MLIGTTHPYGSKQEYKYVVALSRYRGQLLLSRHKTRTTWEGQGGHIEAGETPLQAMQRELFEECGALEFTLEPICDYSANGTHGVFYFADITRLGPLPPSEMAETRCFSTLPANLTYPGIIDVLYEQTKHHFQP